MGGGGSCSTVGWNDFIHQHRFFFAGILLALTAFAYLPVLKAGFIWDDDDYITNNTLLTMSDGWWRIWFSAHSQSQYFPLVFSTFRIEYALWGLNPLGYHLVNVLLHTSNALLIWVLLQKLKIPGAWFAAAVWAIHPVQVETVAWITELKNTESTLFYLLALWSWIKFLIGNDQRKFYALALFLYLLALFAKTTACTFPATMVLVLWLNNKSVTRRRIFQVIPFLVLGFAFGLLSVWWEKHLGNYKSDVGQSFGILERVLIASRAFWFYLSKIIWPTNLAFSYPHWRIDARASVQYLSVAACACLAFALWRFRARATARLIAVAVFFFVAVISPLLGFVPLYTFRYTYVADHLT